MFRLCAKINRDIARNRYLEIFNTKGALLIQRTSSRPTSSSVLRYTQFKQKEWVQKRKAKSKSFTPKKTDQLKSLEEQSKSVSLAAQFLADVAIEDSHNVSSKESLKNDYCNAGVKKKLDDEVNSLMQRLEELSATSIRPADEAVETYDESVDMYDSDGDCSDSDTGTPSSTANLTSFRTAGPVTRVVQLYGSPDSSVPMSNVSCHGCGSKLHCRDPGIPGYLPSQKFLGTPVSELKDLPCQRCHLLKEFNIAIDATVGPDEYKAITMEIKCASALIIILVDLTDLPGSFYSGIAPLIGRGRPVYIIGNKVDLLPKDSDGYLKRVKESLVEMCRNYGMSGDHVKHVALISARTGYGVEPLITQLLNDWRLKGQVYILGCTNVGKSTLFNALLSSDFCRITARDVIRRATTSIWPGTTLSLLKFPIVNPKPARLFERTQRLLAEKSQEVEENNLNRKSLRATGNIKYATLMGHIGQTVRSPSEQALHDKLSKSGGYVLPSYTYKDMPAQSTGDQSSSAGDLINHVGKSVLIEKLKVKTEKYDDKTFKYWCYDTPGLVNPNQVINILSQDELGFVLSKKQIIPRTISLRPNQVMFVSGLGRIDYVEGDVSIYCTVLASHELPIHVIPFNEAEEFYEKNVGQPTLGIPLGDAERLSRIPPLVGHEFKVEGQGCETSSSDIVLSSLGWVSVAAEEGRCITLRAYTPGGFGCAIRTPSLLPFAVNLRGKRIRGTAKYQTRTPKF